MNNLTQRLITAVVGAAVLITGMLWNVYSLIIVLWSLSFAIHFEYLRRVQNLKDHATRVVEIVLNLIIGMLVFSIVPLLYLQTENLVFIPILLFFPLLSLFFIFELFMKRENPYRNIGLNIAGIFYCIVPFALLLSIPLFWGSYLVQLRDINPIFASSGLFILGYFLIVWTHDTMSYFTGKAIGKHKLFERISPKKTWEGFFGGFIFSIGMAILISNYLEFLSLTNWIIIAIIISVFGTLGDLVESMLKRSLALKDSSHILPGHGGFLDRFDATLIAAPFVWLYLALLQL